MKWAYTNEIISSDPTEGLTTFSGKAKKRGILELEEAQRLFALEWKDERSRVGNLLAATTGLRAGEVLALRLEDIGEVIIDIQHSWNPIDGLKTPKSGEARRVPVLPGIRAELLALAAKNPHGLGGKGLYSIAPMPSIPWTRDSSPCLLRRPTRFFGWLQHISHKGASPDR